LALENVSFARDRLGRRSFRRLIGRPTAVVVVAQMRHIVGYVLVLFRRGVFRARVYSLAVDPAWRGRGIGGLLLDAATAAARSRGCTSLGLEVRCDNDAAQSLYRRAGYRPAGMRPNYYADGTSAVVLIRSLEATP
jgi:ribosomal-protein-alanine acetyltransferase